MTTAVLLVVCRGLSEIQHSECRSLSPRRTETGLCANFLDGTRYHVYCLHGCTVWTVYTVCTEAVLRQRRVQWNVSITSMET